LRKLKRRLNVSKAAVGRLSGEIAALRRIHADEIPHLRSDISDLQREFSDLKKQIAGVPGVLDSRIISDFPEIRRLARFISITRELSPVCVDVTVLKSSPLF
jgi:transcriptional regulator of aromatic amino acid metabolism